MASKKNHILSIAKAFIGLVALVVIGHYFNTRFDLTEDHRYTLSQPAINSVRDFSSPVIVDVLMKDGLPPEFARLKEETKQLLEAFAAENKEIKFSFVNPLDEGQETEATITELQGLGLKPASITVEDNGKRSQEILFPWAMVNYDNKTMKVALLKNKLGASSEQRVNNSVQHLEYAFADAFTKLGLKNKKKVAVIKGNGELDDLHIADFLTTIKDYYNIGAITLDSVATNPQKTLDQLEGYDLALIAKPTQRFTDPQKYVLDQFIVHGGKSVFLIDQVAIELDSLFNEKGSTLAFPRDLNLNDFLFNYGVRINPVLINDLYFTQIVLANGEDSNTQYQPVPWYYSPMVFSRNNHPINTNLQAVRFQFANNIDTLANANKKTILYWSSPLSKVEGTPKEISLDLIKTSPNKETYNHGNQPLAVLIEGKFQSAFKNRVKPIDLKNPLDQGPDNKMLVVADGDIIKNQVRNGRPLELGYDKWTNNFYGNKEFLVNSINYLLDDTGLINIRNKKVSIPFLNQEKVMQQKFKWQLINIGLPVVLSIIVGVFYAYLRKRKYGS
ncbi:gliding motility-associated ABC transporter substrate-binding protein GldG [Flavobacteriaceae bacterium F89]|uniref:Gliding motility-associated ABC transporter substrate-binding protein GldG n=1 Tax=Cerina litoralis TaxID=2874477 RepID=A0AAE3JMY5_9FLAO|nr:gliding motility-associated ABC transporter substrate-binding protein GldG [Cerina litoralis]MCG2460395.1 gliding motility-associated ABC transporter substrate-binding protein GldG [Cerina litoralis]